MPRMKTTAIALVALLLVLAPATAADHTDIVNLDIVDTAVKDGRFTTLATALGQADLAKALKGKGPFTVFAPTDKAFAALPDGTLEGLLQDKDALAKALLFHVVSGRVMSSDLLKTRGAKTLSGEQVAIGLSVGQANVIQADVTCSNGVIHVIDRVLIPQRGAQEAVAKPTALPTTKTPAMTKAKRMNPVEAIHAAIDRGAPLFNDGDEEGCARLYHRAALSMMKAGDSLTDWDRMTLAAAMKKPAKDARAQAWNLRAAFDTILENAAFKLKMEAPLPKGFPKAGPLGRVIVKRYPRYRAARASGGSMAFWTLFSHIKSNKVEMTAPVEMTMGKDMRPRDMAFLYERPDQGQAGKQGRVDVLDLEPITVLSIGMRGRRDAADLAVAKRLIEARLKADGYRATGDFRALGYNSPMVAASKQFWEFQVPVVR